MAMASGSDPLGRLHAGARELRAERGLCRTAADWARRAESGQAFSTGLSNKGAGEPRKSLRGLAPAATAAAPVFSAKALLPPISRWRLRVALPIELPLLLMFSNALGISPAD